MYGPCINIYILNIRHLRHSSRSSVNISFKITAAKAVRRHASCTHAGSAPAGDVAGGGGGGSGMCKQLNRKLWK